jgi:hypothetical protein
LSSESPKLPRQPSTSKKLSNNRKSNQSRQNKKNPLNPLSQKPRPKKRNPLRRKRKRKRRNPSKSGKNYRKLPKNPRFPLPSGLAMGISHPRSLRRRWWRINLAISAAFLRPAVFPSSSRLV